ncbi:MAG: preprotein translocase subunit YajC [Akkermansia sp.]
MSTINILAQAVPAAPAAEANAVTTTTQSTEQAPATETTTKQGGDMFSMVTTFLLVGVVFYFLMIRPSMKQQKEAKARQEALKVGDKVVTNAGIHGIIREMQEQTVKLEIAANVTIKINKNCIVSTVDKAGKTDTAATASK